MSELRIDFDKSLTGHLPGDELAGQAEWRLDKDPTALEIRLFWYTKGKGTTDVEIVATKIIDPPRKEGRERFKFVMPDSPYSFSGKLISLIWAVELVVDSGTEAERKEFVMAPDGREVMLQNT
jgi:hypothetical protein